MSEHDGGRVVKSAAAELVPDILKDVDREASEEFEELAVRFARRADLHHPINRSPRAVAAGSVYAAGHLVNEKVTQDDLAEAADVMTYTITKAYRDILDAEDIATEERHEDDTEATEPESVGLIHRLKEAVGLVR